MSLNRTPPHTLTRPSCHLYSSLNIYSPFLFPRSWARNLVGFVPTSSWRSYLYPHLLHWPNNLQRCLRLHLCLLRLSLLLLYVLSMAHLMRLLLAVMSALPVPATKPNVT